MIAFITITATIKPFLSNKGHSAEDVENVSSLVQINHSTSDALVPMPKMHISNLEVLMEFVGVF